jgi:hypothetical protein
MHLHILGDLHLEFGTTKIPVADADVVVLAGDIHLGREGRKYPLLTFTGMAGRSRCSPMNSRSVLYKVLWLCKEAK